MRTYEEYKTLYPNWSDDQIWTAISIDMEAEKAISKGGANVDIDDPDVWNSIMKGAREWIRVALPRIFERVKEWFSNMMSRISNWLKEHLNLDTIFSYISSLGTEPTNQKNSYHVESEI